MSLILSNINLIVSLKVAPEDKFLPAQRTGVWIVFSVTLHVSLYLVPGDETPTTMIWILPRMFLYLSLYVVAEFESTATQSTIICNLPSMTFHVSR